jgi:hypothetical protein
MTPMDDPPVEDEDASNWEVTDAAIAATAASTAATQILRNRVRRVADSDLYTVRACLV